MFRGHLPATLAALGLFTSCQSFSSGSGPAPTPPAGGASGVGQAGGLPAPAAGSAVRSGGTLGQAGGDRSATAADRSLGPAFSAKVSVEPPALAEPLRDPRERRLRRVRQLTEGHPVASPHFTADGQALLFIQRRGARLALWRVALEGGPPQEVTSAAAPGTVPWQLVGGSSGPCALFASSRCPLGGWPEPAGLLSCAGTVLVAVGAEQSCPGLGPAGLPCAVSPDLNRSPRRQARPPSACPTPAADGGVVLMVDFGDGGAHPVGPSDGLALQATFSRDGARLVYVLSAADRPSQLWQLPLTSGQLAPAMPQPLGPEATFTADPTFAPGERAVVFASSADDAAGGEVDLISVPLFGGSLERVTFSAGTDRFPTFSPSGKWLAWVSERNADLGGADLYVAEWQREPE